MKRSTAFGIILKNVRKARGLTQVQAARVIDPTRLNATRVMIAEYETGKKSPRFETAITILQRLGYEIELKNVRDRARPKPIEAVPSRFF